jgi:hypothetical protein
LAVATVPTLAAFALAVLDTMESGFGELTRLGMAMESSRLAVAAMLPLACLVGAWRWVRPGVGSAPLTAAWAAFLIPFVYALLPASALYRVQPMQAAAASPSMQAADTDEEPDSEGIDPETLEKALSLKEMVVEFVLYGGGYLLLLPAVLSLIPGAVNGCLRVKALVPAAQRPGWLLVCAAPAFLLFWLVLLVVANHAARSPLLVFGVLLWAGSPIVYSVFGKVFVQPHLSDEDAARIARVKRLVGAIALGGIALLVAFALTKKLAGLNIVGFDRAAAVTTQLERLMNQDDEVSLEDVQAAVARSKSFLYAFYLSSYKFVVDVLAKLLVARRFSRTWCCGRRSPPGATTVPCGLATGGRGTTPPRRPSSPHFSPLRRWGEAPASYPERRLRACVGGCPRDRCSGPCR